MTAPLNTRNYARTTLNMPGGFTAGGTSMTFATVDNMPPVPFIFEIKDTASSVPELGLATALNGSTYTVVMGQEQSLGGTAPANHVNGAIIRVVLSAGMYAALLAGSGNNIPISGAAGALTLIGNSNKVFVDLGSEACSAQLPAAGQQGRVVEFIDFNNNAAANNFTLTSVSPINGVSDPTVVYNTNSFTDRYIDNGTSWNN